MLTKKERDFYEVVYFKEGFKCIIRKDRQLGHLCGYVVIPERSPFYGICRNKIPIAVHGGITYACHEDEDYDIGFDCAHYGDYVPGIAKELERAGYITALMQGAPRKEMYRNVTYVKKEISHMIRQVDSLEHSPITYKKAGKMMFKGRGLFFKNSGDAGYIDDIGDYKSLTHFIVKEYNRYAYEPQTPAQVMASKWYLIKEAK